MIPIKPDDNVKLVCDRYVKSIINYIKKPKRKPRKTYYIKCWEKKFKRYFDIDSFESFLKANPNTINDIVSKYKQLGEKDKKKIKKTFVVFLEFYKYLTDSERVFTYNNKEQKLLGRKIVEELNIKVCPYCNRNFIFDVDKSRSSELDHFYPKKEYPFLAISFYNLIPSCKPCNQNKRSKTTNIINPYDTTFDFKSVRFSLNDDCAEVEIADEKNIEIKLVADNYRKNTIINHNKVFSIDKLYNNHKDIVLELLKKRVMYQDKYIDDLYEKFGLGPESIFSTRNELLRLITGIFIEEENLCKRPLSKLQRDILKQLKFID